MADEALRRGVTVISGTTISGSTAGRAAMIASGGDECSVIEAMRGVERAQRPGLITLYYNGRNWLMYDDQPPRFLSP